MHVLAQALDRLRKSKGGLPGGEFEEAVSAARVARECVVVSEKSRVGLLRLTGVNECYHLLSIFF